MPGRRTGGGAAPGAGLSLGLPLVSPPPRAAAAEDALRRCLPGKEPRLRSRQPIGGSGAASPPPPRPRPLRRRRFPAPPPPPPGAASVAATATAAAGPGPASARPPESSRSRSRCPRPRHERKRRRRGRRRRRLSSCGRRALPASVVVSQAGRRRARAPAPPAPPTAAAPARARRCRPPQPFGPRASPGGRPGWRRLRPSAGSRYGVRERAGWGGAWVGFGGGGPKGVRCSRPTPRRGWSVVRVSFVRPRSPCEPCVPVAPSGSQSVFPPGG